MGLLQVPNLVSVRQSTGRLGGISVLHIKAREPRELEVLVPVRV